MNPFWKSTMVIGWYPMKLRNTRYIGNEEQWRSLMAKARHALRDARKQLRENRAQDPERADSVHADLKKAAAALKQLAKDKRNPDFGYRRVR